MVVTVDTRSGFSTGLPRKLFTGKQVTAELSLPPGVFPALPPYDVTADGQRFVVVQSVSGRTVTLMVVQNWFAEFKKQ